MHCIGQENNHSTAEFQAILYTAFRVFLTLPGRLVERKMFSCQLNILILGKTYFSIHQNGGLMQYTLCISAKNMKPLINTG